MRLLVQQRQLLVQALRASPAATRIHPSDTNYLLIQTPAPELLMAMMQRAGIKIRDRSKVPGIEGCVRLTVGTPDQNERVLKVFQEYARRSKTPQRRADSRPRQR
jgi:histidinol-phosphate aminotransferase